MTTTDTQPIVDRDRVIDLIELARLTGCAITRTIFRLDEFAEWLPILDDVGTVTRESGTNSLRAVAVLDNGVRVHVSYYGEVTTRSYPSTTEVAVWPDEVQS